MTIFNFSRRSDGGKYTVEPHNIEEGDMVKLEYAKGTKNEIIRVSEIGGKGDNLYFRGGVVREKIKTNGKTRMEDLQVSTKISSYR